MQVVWNCKGRLINKLQNSVILLVFQILEKRNIQLNYAKTVLPLTLQSKKCTTFIFQ